MENSINTFVQKKFEEIKHVDENGIEYWEARELMPILEYTEWRNFTNIISKAQESCKNSAQTIEDHFVDVNKMIKIATGTDKQAYREVKD
jgi:DNA-damage-inducible protein D